RWGGRAASGGGICCWRRSASRRSRRSWRGCAAGRGNVARRGSEGNATLAYASGCQVIRGRDMASWWHRLPQWLLWVDVPGDAGLVGVEGSVRNSWAVALTLLFVLLAAAGIVALYFFESKRVGVARRLCLAALRTAIVTVLFFLLFRPVQLVAVFKGERPRGVA